MKKAGTVKIGGLKEVTRGPGNSKRQCDSTCHIYTTFQTAIIACHLLSYIRNSKSPIIVKIRIRIF